MHIFKCLFAFSCLFDSSFANLKLCSQPEEKLSKKEVLEEVVICFTNETGYSAPFPITLVLEFYIKNVIKIDEDLDSISIQVELWTYWIDPGLDYNPG